MVVETGERRLVFDFRARRKYVVNPGAGTYIDYSLYADAGFKSYEILNRELLAKAMAAALPDRMANAVALAEHELAIAHPPAGCSEARGRAASS